MGAAIAAGFFLTWVLVWRLSRASSPLEAALDKLTNAVEQLDKNQDRLEHMLMAGMTANRHEMSDSSRQNREELANSVKSFESAILARLSENSLAQAALLDSFSQQLAALNRSNEARMEQIRQTLEQKTRELQEGNASQLEQMRVLVDEKLHATLEQRLGDSFKMVSERLEMVHKGLGEMQVLASGVGDLKKVLTNVKTRGTWGEAQLGAILNDILAPEQFAANVAVKNNGERVEYAIKLPGADESRDYIWLPLDAKFPLEDYQRLEEACEKGDAALIEQAGRQLESQVKIQAREIARKYIDPPNTTDFAILFMPTESLYAEVLRRPGLFEHLRREFRIIAAGPTTLAALVNSLALGFQTLAVQKRSSEVWALLGAVKTEFGKFGAVLEKTQKKLQEASNTIDEATRRSRAMERKLRTVEALPEGPTELRESGTDL